MKRLRSPFPPGLGLPILLVTVLTVGALVGARSVEDALLSLLVIAAFVVALVGGARLLRNRRRARRLASPGVFFARTADTLGIEDLLGPTRWWSFFLDALALEVRVDTNSGVVLRPTRTGRWFSYREATLQWSELAGISTGGDTHEVGAQVSLTSLTPVTFVVVGERVPDWFTPLTDEEGADEGLTPDQVRAHNDEALVDFRELHGTGFAWGTLPVTLLVEDGRELADLARPYCRGQMPG